MISERVKLGLERVKSKGVKLGRPTSVTEESKKEIREMVTDGQSFAKIAKVFNVSKMTVSRINREPPVNSGNCHSQRYRIL